MARECRVVTYGTKAKIIAPVGKTYLHQVVSFPDHNEDIVSVYGVSPVTTAGLPTDATLEGYVFTYADEGVQSVKLPLFYSESWRTWYPISDFVKGE